MSSLDGLEALRHDWTDLWRRDPSATPFQSPEWLIPWWKHFGHEDLLVLTLRRHGTLLGLVPLFISEGAGERVLLPIGCGITDYCDGLFDPSIGQQGAAIALAYLASENRRWDLCDLQQLRPDSVLLHAPSPSGWVDRRIPQEPSPVLPIPGTVEALARQLPRRMAANLRYYRRRASKLGRLCAEAAEAETVAASLDALVRLHGACWHYRGLPGVLADQAIRRFHEEAAPLLLARDMLRLYVLRLDNRTVAAFYGFADRTRTHYYLSGFDPAFAGLSPGTLIVAHAIEQAVRERAAEFHFLRGGEDYKYHWGAEDRPSYSRQFRRGGIRSVSLLSP
ncbi:GNAT family N-acetyltransferase [Rhodospirillaceae bacterium SYSU D60014]|uniref:GNAT family N-acetyltransferase n=1 Tax=Virgifigura deserti TaxID=2268457 RepID=UPI0013C5109F